MWKKYRSEGIQAFRHYPFEGTKGKLSEEQKTQLLEELRQDRVQTLEAGKAYIQAHFGISYTTGGVSYLFRQMGIKKKTGRPCNVRKDAKGAEVFKKNSSSTKAALRRAALF